MKKIILLITFLISIIFLNSLTLKNFYQKNYGSADRSVFVFDDCPDYLLEKQNDKISITIKNCSTDAPDQEILDNQVLTSYKITEKEGNTVIEINLNLAEQDDRICGVEDFFLKDYNKLVLDIFKYDIPLSEMEFKERISFYNLVGLKKQAAKFTDELASFLEKEAEIIPDETGSIEEPDTKVIEQEKPLPVEKMLKPFTALQDFYYKITGSMGILQILVIALFAVAIMLLIIVLAIMKKDQMIA